MHFPFFKILLPTKVEPTVVRSCQTIEYSDWFIIYVVPPSSSMYIRTTEFFLILRQVPQMYSKFVKDYVRVSLI